MDQENPANSLPSNGRFLTDLEIQARLKVCKKTVWTLRQRGLPHYRIGKALRYDMIEVANWLRAEANKK